MQCNLSKPLAKLQTLCRQCIRSRGFSSGRVPTFPDPPCQDIDKKCHFVSRDSCAHARNVLRRVLPADKYLDELQQEGPGKCCVYRPSHSHPCPEFKSRVKEEPPQPPFRSMWEPPCKPHEQPHCTELLPRFDDMYYRPSEACRCYQRTWIECPRVKLRMKKVCCLDGIEPPEVLYRFKERCPKVACELDYERMRRLCQHIKDPEHRCDKIHWPCCRPARCVPHCDKARQPSTCRKLATPYPSYSESRKPWERPKRYRECQCTRQISQCEVMEYEKRLKMRGLTK